MIYFDNAATGLPKPKEVIYAVKNALINCGNPGRGLYTYSLIGSDIIYSVRDKLATLFGTSTEKVVLCPGATYALNYAIKGLKQENTQVLISDLEHNSVIRPCYSYHEPIIFETDLSDDKITIENFKKSISKNNVSLVAITHASNVCGRILPIKEIAKICRSKNIPIVLDASQTAGYIEINFSEYPVDVICIPGHKGFYGPMGTGALIVNPTSNLHFKTLIEGGTGIRSIETSMPEELPERLEGGTLSVQDFAGFSAAISNCKYSIKETREMLEYILSPLLNIPNLVIHSTAMRNIENYMPIISLNVENIPSSEFAKQLIDRGFCVRSGFHCAPMVHKKLNTGNSGSVRISIGKNNTLDDCKKLIKAVKQICQKQ